MTRPRLVLMLALLICAIGTPMLSNAADRNPNTDWLRDGQVGVFMHLLPGDPQGLERVGRFDVDALAAQLEELDASDRVECVQIQPLVFEHSPPGLDHRIGVRDFRAGPTR